MKKLVLSFLSTTLLLIGLQKAEAQSYKNAIGVRLGPYNGLNYKTFLTGTSAIDLNLSFRSYGDEKKATFITALYELHNPITELPGLKWYYGVGGSLGSIKQKKENGELFLSADGVLGLDYKFVDAPFNVAVDWRPRFQLTQDTNINASDVGASVRFTF